MTATVVKNVRLDWRLVQRIEALALRQSVSFNKAIEQLLRDGLAASAPTVTLTHMDGREESLDG